MAIRYREKYKTWQVYYRHPVTKKIVSQSYDTKEEAEKENSLIAHRLKYERESFYEAPDTTNVTAPHLDQSTRQTIESVYLEYLKEKQFSKKELTTHFAQMKKVFQITGNIEISSITKKDLEEIKEKILADTSVAQPTLNARLRQLRTLIYYAVKKGYLESLVFPRIPAAKYKAFIPPTPEEIDALYAAAPPHLQRVIILGAYLGVRVGECELLQLTWSDIDLGKKICRIHGSKKNKNAQYREVPIRESLVPTFEYWQNQDLAEGVQYLIHYKGLPVKSIKTSWQHTLRRAGITRHIRPYDLRHAFGTELVAAGVDVGTVAKLMGHSNPTMLLTHYQYVMDAQKRKAVEELPEPPVCRDLGATYRRC